MYQLRPADLAVFAVYVVGVVGMGCWFVRRSRTPAGFTRAGGSLPGWAVGLSIFGTFLSSLTFLGVPGKAYGSNWNSFVFSLSLPIAAWLAARFFVPFYRRRGEISAYEHFEERFGGWARTYAVVCYLLTQIARMGAILFGVALALQALTGWPAAAIIVATGVLVTLYTLLGGIEAVIWTDVVQSTVLSAGALLVAGIILADMPEGPQQVFAIAAGHDKFSLGRFDLDVTASTFWLVLLYGLFINLTNFGIDQNYVQRYHASNSEQAAARSVWIGALLYIPVAALFFFIGTALFAYYEAQPAELSSVRADVALSKLRDTNTAAGDPAGDSIASVAAALQPSEYGDRVFPHFIATKLPPGMAGLLIAALFAAAMSSIDTSLNSSSTVILSDLYQRYIDPMADERRSMRMLHASTLVMGAVGTGGALAMIGVKSLLDAWWNLSGVFAGGLLGLFLLGLIARRPGRAAGVLGVLAGLVVIVWLTFSPDERLGVPATLRSPFHEHLIIVFGTATIFVVGLLVAALVPGGPMPAPGEPER